MLIQQAIFTSVHTDRTQGYQLVSHSPGLTESEAQELAVWGPSHDSLAEHASEAASTNFFQLTSGRYCVSRTSSAGAEYSGRGGSRVYTQFLVVPPEVFARFGNNPFAILRAVKASGAIDIRKDVPQVLEPLRLGGRAPAVDAELLAHLVRDPGPKAMATLLQAVLNNDRLAVASRVSGDALIAGLLALLPVECRTEFSFTTGLKLSPSRPVRLLTLPTDPENWRAVFRGEMTLLDMESNEFHQESSWEGWPDFIAHVLSTGKYSLLTAEFDRPHPGLHCAGLNALAEEARAGLPASVRERLESEVVETRRPLAPQAVVAMEEPSTSRRADRAHLIRQKVQAVTEKYVPKSSVEELAAVLVKQPPEVLELLEHIDDLIFDVIGGNKQALEELEALWPVVVADLDENLVEQSREQYLRCALAICNDSIEGEQNRPERALAAIEVLCLLFGD